MQLFVDALPPGCCRLRSLSVARSRTRIRSVCSSFLFIMNKSDHSVLPGASSTPCERGSGDGCTSHLWFFKWLHDLQIPNQRCHSCSLILFVARTGLGARPGPSQVVSYDWGCLSSQLVPQLVNPAFPHILPLQLVFPACPPTLELWTYSSITGALISTIAAGVQNRLLVLSSIRLQSKDSWGHDSFFLGDCLSTRLSSVLG